MIADCWYTQQKQVGNLRIYIYMSKWIHTVYNKRTSLWIPLLGILGIKRSILGVVLHGVNWSIKGVLILVTDLGYPDILRSLFCSQQSATLRGYRQISAPRHVAKKSSSSHGMCIGDSDATVQLAKTTVSRLFKPLKKADTQSHTNCGC